MSALFISLDGMTGSCPTPTFTPTPTRIPIPLSGNHQVFMRHVPILEFVNEDELDRLIPVFNVRRYRKGEAVVRQGEK